MTYHMKFQGLQQKLSLGGLKMIYDDENLQPCRLGVFWDGTFIEKKSPELLRRCHWQTCTLGNLRYHKIPWIPFSARKKNKKFISPPRAKIQKQAKQDVRRYIIYVWTLFVGILLKFLWDWSRHHARHFKKTHGITHTEWLWCQASTIGFHDATTYKLLRIGGNIFEPKTLVPKEISHSKARQNAWQTVETFIHFEIFPPKCKTPHQNVPDFIIVFLLFFGFISYPYRITNILSKMF